MESGLGIGWVLSRRLCPNWPDFQMGLVSVGMMLRVKVGVAIECAWSG